MRTLVASLMMLPLSCGFLSAAAPPLAVPSEIGKLIEQLGDDDVDVRKGAMKKLEAMGDNALPALNKLVKSEKDIDVRLRMMVVIRAIDAKNWGLVRVMGAGAAIKVFPFGGGYWLNRVQFSRDGKSAVAAGGGLIVFDLATGKETSRVLEVGGARPGLAVSSDGKYVLTAHASQTQFHLVEWPSLKTFRTFTGHTLGMQAVAISNDSSRVVSLSADSTIRLWDVKGGNELGRLLGFAGWPRCAAFSPKGKRLLVGMYGIKGNPLVYLWDVETKKRTQAFTVPSARVVGVAFSPDGKKGVFACAEGTVHVFDLESAKELVKMDHKAQVNDLAVSPDGKRALTAGTGDKLVKLWDLRTGKQVYSFDGHVGGVLGVAFSPDGRQALSCDNVCCVRLWKLGKR